jgi:hypothetical protein
MTPVRFFVEGRDFLSKAELTEMSIKVVDQRVVLIMGPPYDVRMTPAEAEALAHVLLTASRAVRGQ